MVPPKVVVIGCGPGGMFFLHALETQRRMLKEAGDTKGIAALPTVRCFERSSEPGGVWRAKRKFKQEPSGLDEQKLSGGTSSEEKKSEDGTATPTGVETTNMYEALWTNGPKECIEFIDYTYDEHFQCPLPVYMPRQALLDYMLARVKRHSPNIFEDYVSFNTSVISVTFDSSTSKFQVVSKNTLTDATSVENYDKCIWAGGENGGPNMPPSLCKVFDGKFKGKVIHSSNTADFKEDVKGKNVLLVGGSYSAEDLALMAIKVGAKKVYVSHRSSEDAITWTSSWPEDRVTLLTKLVPVGVTGDGRSLQFSKMSYVFPNKYEINDTIDTVINDIDTVIFCTGYYPNLSMLDKSLQPSLDPSEERLHIPDNWKMKPNIMSDIFGEIPPGDVRPGHGYVRPGLHRNLLISNPSMMFFFALSDNPLLDIDALAWRFLAYVTGKIPTPTCEEMKAKNLEQTMREMDIPYLRVGLDSNYLEAWSSNFEENDDHPILDDCESEGARYELMRLAEDLREGSHPLDIGTGESLNELGETMIMFNEYDCRGTIDPDNTDENEWKTFRDCDHTPFFSLYTGTKAVPLKKRWLDIETNEKIS